MPAARCRRPAGDLVVCDQGPDDSQLFLHAITLDRDGGDSCTQVAGLGPELLEVGGIRRDHAPVEHREGVHPHGAVPEPRARRESHAGHLRQGIALLRR